MLPSWCEDAVTVLRAPMVARRGVDVPDWGSAQARDVAGCSLQAASAATDFGGSQRSPQEYDATLLMPEGADVQAGDRVVAGGVTWEVSGAFDVRSPTGAVSHRRALLKRWRG